MWLRFKKINFKKTINYSFFNQDLKKKIVESM